jgi:hypothetical protein
MSCFGHRSSQVTPTSVLAVMGDLLRDVSQPAWAFAVHASDRGRCLRARHRAARGTITFVVAPVQIACGTLTLEAAQAPRISVVAEGTVQPGEVLRALDQLHQQLNGGIVLRRQSRDLASRRRQGSCAVT